MQAVKDTTTVPGPLATTKTDNALVVSTPTEETTKTTKRKILDEDSYIESLEKIIQRDFFPDVAKLQAQKDYLEAEDNGDLERMRQIAIKYGSSLTKSTPRNSVPYVTPATFETPEGRPSSPASVQGKTRARTGEEGKVEEEEEKPLPSLDKFLAKTTSVKDEEAVFKKPRDVVHKNTRFIGDPFSKALNKSQLQQAAALNAQFKQGRVGPDGKELTAHDSPKVNGYGFEGTPSPAPGVAESPLMTWGRRERLGLKMANEAAAKNRAKKQEALRKVTENLASLTPKGLSPALSPALQRLVNRSSSKYTDKALRASYTPSPAHRASSASKTPLGGAGATPRGTPTPRNVRTPTTQDPASITDNLLQLPKRRKAADFF
ncbi:hypothetical protein JZ751_005725 [Albula glossodonta]|uniref:Splicing factor ESS-2 homolog n=1 Tax=Albula glossodonta TaxID=121402 RepID=A0A8T2N6N2_9TELE|nr:hypothetical protein JZ751_005725 [Albula glossodonta]